jgi:hypothetical protein
MFAQVVHWFFHPGLNQAQVGHSRPQLPRQGM